MLPFFSPSSFWKTSRVCSSVWWGSFLQVTPNTRSWLRLLSYADKESCSISQRSAINHTNLLVAHVDQIDALFSVAQKVAKKATRLTLCDSFSGLFSFILSFPWTVCHEAARVRWRQPSANGNNTRGMGIAASTQASGSHPGHWDQLFLWEATYVGLLI